MTRVKQVRYGSKGEDGQVVHSDWSPVREDGSSPLTDVYGYEPFVEGHSHGDGEANWLEMRVRLESDPVCTHRDATFQGHALPGVDGWECYCGEEILVDCNC